MLQITFVNHLSKRTEDSYDVAKMLETSFTCHRNKVRGIKWLFTDRIGEGYF